MKPILPLLFRLALALVPVTAAGAAGQPPSQVAGREIEQLFAALESSRCQFYRNGSWHGAAEASAHLRRKYEYLAERGLTPSAEAFIERAASQSSVSGKPYLVRCGTAEAVESRVWFMGKLREMRASARTPG